MEGKGDQGNVYDLKFGPLQFGRNRYTYSCHGTPDHFVILLLIDLGTYKNTSSRRIDGT